MGVDCGFDIYSPLERTKANQEQYELFLREVLVAYGPRDGDDADWSSGGDGGSVVRVNAELEESYIDFVVGEHPHLPRRCEHFLRFSSKISGRSLAEPYIRGAVQRKIGEHKKQAEEREQEETKIQGEVQQGGDGTDGMADVPARTNDSTRILGPA